MPDLATGRNRLPLLAVSQALKEVTPNEALVLIDALLHTEIENILSLAPVPTDIDIAKMLPYWSSSLWHMGNQFWSYRDLGRRKLAIC